MITDRSCPPIPIKQTTPIVYIMISLIIDFQCLESSRRGFCEHYFDVRVICEEDESVDSIALKAIATADRYPKDKGRSIL